MADDDDDAEEHLANNLFLRAMRTKFKDIWSKAEESLMFVCVPQVSASVRRRVCASSCFLLFFFFFLPFPFADGFF